MSHNVYSDDVEFTRTKLPNYLILINNQVFFSDCISDVINICADEKRICSVYRLNGSMGKYWDYLCDISKGVL